MDNLTQIYMYFCSGIDDLSPLAQLENLEYVALYEVEDLTDISPLMDCDSIWAICILGCEDIAETAENIETIDYLTEKGVSVETDLFE